MLCRYIFPGLALGAALGQTGVITNAMINRAAEVSTRETVWCARMLTLLALRGLIYANG
jgi:hypothetical protein